MRPGREAVSMPREYGSHGTVEGFSGRGMKNGCVVDDEFRVSLRPERGAMDLVHAENTGWG